MAILITGSGTVGMQAVRSAIEKGLEEVIVLDIAPNKEFIESIAGKDFILEKGNITNLPFIMEIIKKYKIKRIVHTAVVPEEYPYLYETIYVNTMGTTNIFEAARLMDVERVISCSSGGVYDFTKMRPKAPVDEDWPICPKDNIPYYSTKIAIEGIARNYNHRFHTDIITTRLAGNFGPSVKYNMGDKQWIYTLIKNALVKKVLKYDSMQTRYLPWTYAKDTADCLIHIAYSDTKPKSPVYNCAYPGLYGLREMLDILKKLIPNLKVEIKEIIEIGWKYPYDVRSIQNDFNFNFKYDAKEAFKDYIEWIKANPKYNL